VVELVLIGWLTAAGGDPEQVTAAVLVYRALTWALPILIGICCYVWWHQSRLRPSPVAAGDRRMAIPKVEGTADTHRPHTQPRDSQPRSEQALGLGHATKRERITSPKGNR
jgi:hypothetical protein